MKQINKNTKAVIMGNGPSLSTIDFDKFKDPNVVTFATNRIADICKSKDWHPDYYAAFFCEPFRGETVKLPNGKVITYPGDKRISMETREDIEHVSKNQKTTCYVHEWYKYFLKPRKNIVFTEPRLWNRFEDLPLNCFETYKAPENFLWHIATTALFQLCFSLNIKTIGVIGQDGYNIDKKLNHFAGYRGTEPESVKKSLFANKRINRLHDAVKINCEKNDIEIYNLSEDSILEQHQYIDFNKFMEI